MIRYIDSIDPVFFAHKRVLLRVDFNVTFKDGGQYDDSDVFRVRASLDTIQYLLRHGAYVGIISHRGEEQSFEDLIPIINSILNINTAFAKRIEDLSRLAKQHRVALAENLRMKAGEINDDDHFAKILSTGFDIYINDAFSVCHRKHASVSSITNHLPSFGGLLLKRELDLLESFVSAPSKGKTLIVGGAKNDTKIPIIKSFIGKAEYILVGGAIANELINSRKIKKEYLVLPFDFIIAQNNKNRFKNINHWPANKKIPHDYQAFDIGDKTIEYFVKIIRKSKMVLWNGPLGLAEVTPFDNATLKIAQSLNHHASAIIGGGDTVSYLMKHHAIPSQSLVSTGGGAMLSYLAGEVLPGLQALGYYGHK